MNEVSLVSPKDICKWSLRGGKIAHESNRFFSIAQVRTKFGTAPFVIQDEIGLLAWVRCKDWFLVQSKFEPGNIGEVQKTCTVQATQSNLDRVHKGKKPEYADLFDGVDRVLQSEQGTKFLGKRNGNAMLDIPDSGLLGDLHPGFSWVHSEELAKLLLTDFSVTTDARSALVCSEWDGWMNRPKTKFSKQFWLSRNKDSGYVPPAGEFEPNYSIEPILNLDEFGSEVVWVKVKTSTRETTEWEQPLLTSDHPTFIDLYICTKGAMKVAFLPATETGLTKVELGPSLMSKNMRKRYEGVNGRVLAHVWQSEEGGRFWKDVNSYRLVEIDTYLLGYEWLTIGDIQKLVVQDMTFTNEARSALALLLAYASAP